MKLIDVRRGSRPVLGAPMPPSIARIPLVQLCTCRHPREAHEHYHRADDCAQCDCRQWVRWEPGAV